MKRPGTTGPMQPHVEMFLAGDFESPLHVLAAQELDAAHKIEVLEYWRYDLLDKEDMPEVEVMLASIDEALATLRGDGEDHGES